MFCSELGERWHAVRSEPTLVHLDSAAAGRSSRAVIEVITDHLRRETERGAAIQAAQLGTGHLGAGEHRAGDVGAGQIGVAESRGGEPGAAQDGAAQMGLP